MSENPVRRKFSRHIDIRRYFVRDMVAASVIKLVPLRTHLMVADALTKSFLPQHTSSTGTLCWAMFLSLLLLALCATSSGGGLMISLSLSLTCRDRGSLPCGDRGSFF